MTDQSFDFEAAFEESLAAVPDDQFDPEQFVPGAGPLDADVMLVGEAPGENEVEEGEPFVGNAGRRLASILDEIGVEQEELYVTNAVKVRPEGNATPTRAALDAWKPVLEAEIARVDPELVVPLGTTATRELLATDDGVTEVRGESFDRDGRTVLPTFHPAATFYDESKRDVLEDDLRAALVDRENEG